MKYKIALPQVIFELGKRENQEDSIYPLAGLATEDNRFFLVCDGMGGHDKGEVASSTVCETISNYLHDHFNPDEQVTEDMLQGALDAAYTALDNRDDVDSYRKMGTTLTLLCFHTGGCLAAHIGDSRIYQIRPSTRNILYKSKDHSLVYALFEAGEITEEETYTSPQRNILTRAMQPHQDYPARATICQLTDVQAGDYFYLCSDGMIETMRDEELLDIFCNANTTEEQICQTLISQTKDNHDNHSAYIIHVLDVEQDVLPESTAQAVADNSFEAQSTLIPSKEGITNTERVDYTSSEMMIMNKQETISTKDAELLKKPENLIWIKKFFNRIKHYFTMNPKNNF